MGKFTDKCNVIARTYDALVAIYDDADLRKEDLSLTDYQECKRLMPLLGAPGNVADTIYDKAAGFFKKHGYTVKERGIVLQITI